MRCELNELLNDFEENPNSDSSIEFVHANLDGSEDDIELYLRAMFVLLDRIVEGSFPEEMRMVWEGELRQMFDESCSHYSNSALFLGFAGAMITRGESHFDRSFEDGIKMIKRAADLEPDNSFFRSLYWVFADQRTDVNFDEKFRALKTFFTQSSNQEDLENRGILGRYFLGIFENVYDGLLLRLSKRECEDAEKRPSDIAILRRDDDVE
jgi:hypothetical protein